MLCHRAGIVATHNVDRNQSEPSSVLAALLWHLAEGVCFKPRICTVLKAAHDATFVGFPKFQQLVGILESMIQSKTAFHGIVFVRQRQGVHAVATMLKTLPHFAAKVKFHTFTGHSAKTKAQLAREGNETAGMPPRLQQEAMDKFQLGTGREIMVATAAAQEGLNIVNCSFVVCYNVTQCGVQLMQWRGRTRRMHSFSF